MYQWAYHLHLQRQLCTHPQALLFSYISYWPILSPWLPRRYLWTWPSTMWNWMYQWSQWVCILTSTLYELMLARNIPCSSSLLSSWKIKIYLHQPFNPFSSCSLISVAFIHNLRLSPLCLWLSNLNSVLESVPRTTSKCPMACDLLHLNVRSRTLNSVHPYLSSPFLLYFIKKRNVIAVFKTDNYQGPIVQHMELCSMSCGSLYGRGVWGRMDRCICMTESLYRPPETITTLYNVL